jgi:hypothetical protein
MTDRTIVYHAKCGICGREIRIGADGKVMPCGCVKISDIPESRKRHPGDFYGEPSNEQKEYWKRGGR